ncbi:hypothetical protein ME805_09390 [Lactobacillus delbrueckii]|nr:hypothetical protein ME798_18900 [Lactobacillus delbrueckii]GHN54726.1 hypothetical protein ME803_06750 [Lactobacillus delbrueckii]GHN57592.1 hypothetical protein ME804_16320 [Lactobacillus delbrueckii]GHN58715.1 hypothetical protein ME805_09390 [Lactobacillus delbrueckii]
MSSLPSFDTENEHKIARSVLSADLPVAGDFVVFLGLVLIAGLERFLASLLRSSTI